MCQQGWLPRVSSEPVSVPLQPSRLHPECPLPHRSILNYDTTQTLYSNKVVSQAHKITLTHTFWEIPFTSYRDHHNQDNDCPPKGPCA